MKFQLPLSLLRISEKSIKSLSQIIKNIYSVKYHTKVMSSLSLSLVWLILVAAQSLTCSETIDSQFCMVFYWIDILTTAELGRGVLFPACWGGKEKRFLPCEGHWQSAMVKILDRPESSLRFFHKIVGTYRTGAKRGFTLKGAHKAACTLEQGQQQ